MNDSVKYLIFIKYTPCSVLYTFKWLQGEKIQTMVNKVLPPQKKYLMTQHNMNLNKMEMIFCSTNGTHRAIIAITSVIIHESGKNQ
jgi:replication-associated recombination protein RarA